MTEDKKKPIQKRSKSRFRMKPRETDNRKGRFEKIKNLKCFREVESMMLQSIPISKIAEFIQDYSNEYTEIKKDSLLKILKQFRDTLNPIQILSPRNHMLTERAQERAEEGLTELDRLDALWKLQARRVARGEAHEEHLNIGITDNVLDKSVAVLAQISKMMHEIRMDLGLLGGKNKGTTTISNVEIEQAKRMHGDDVAKVLESPKSRGRVLATFGNLVSISGGKDEQ